MARKETGVQFLARLGSRPSLEKIEPALFGEGPYCKDVIELYGGEGCSKTETCLHFIVRCILPDEWIGIQLGGCDAGVVLIDNDYSFSVLRLATLMERLILQSAKKCSKNVSSDDIDKLISACLRKLHIQQCSNSTQFVVTLHQLETLILNEAGISAIIIDSISAFYWLDRYNGGDNTQAQEANMKLAVEALSKLVNTYNLVLVVTKAAVFKKKGIVSDKTGKVTGDFSSADDLESEHNEFLSKSWQRMVTNRLVFLRVPESHQQQVYMVGGDSMQGTRKFIVTEYGLQFES